MRALEFLPWLACALVGIPVVVYRLTKAFSRCHEERTQSVDVSIIVPARNEEKNLPVLLTSLKALEPRAREIIVVDDNSTDATGEIAISMGARVVTPGSLPSGWVGKSWACQAGAEHAKGEFLLFTDADTVHSIDSLSRAVGALKAQNVDLLSVIPSHRIESVWERFQGVFHLLLLIATGAGAEPKGGERRFTIGQYLLIRSKRYRNIGGHTRLRGRLAEDLAMAKLVTEEGGQVGLLHSPGLLQVRMYPEGMGAFFRGWRRSFYEGIGSAGFWAMIEMVATIGWLLGGPLLIGMGLESGTAWILGLGLAETLLALGAIAHYQAQLGRFRAWSALGYPAFTFAFVIISILAALDRLFGLTPMWKGRRVTLHESDEVAP